MLTPRELSNHNRAKGLKASEEIQSGGGNLHLQVHISVKMNGSKERSKSHAQLYVNG